MTAGNPYWVMHVDLDQFIAAVEILRRPELAGLPVVVGGANDPTQRAVVATASYAAREFGIRSGMPLRTAAKRCPDAVFLHADNPAYEAASAQVMAVLRELAPTSTPGGPAPASTAGGPAPASTAGGPAPASTAGGPAPASTAGGPAPASTAGGPAPASTAGGPAPASTAGGPAPASTAGGPAALEVMGWDEAFLGVHTADPEAFAREVQAAVLAGTALHCSVGIGDNLLRAKIATDFGKPGGVYRLTAANWFDVMGERPTRALWGIGTKTERSLAARGLRTVHELAAADPAALAADLGPAMGPYFVQLGRGIGRARVDPTPWVPRSHGRETTFPENLTDPDAIRAEVAALARRVAAEIADLDGAARPAARVAVKVRFAPFTTRTRSVTLPEPTHDPAVIEAAVLEVFARFTAGRAVRLIGVRAEFPGPP